MKWPIDFDALALGTFITPEEIIAAFPDRHLERGTEGYQFAILDLRRMIERHFRCRTPPRDVEIQQQGGGLQICDDQASAAYARERSHALHRGLRRHFRKALDVDTANLTPDQIQAHDRHVLIEGRRFQAMEAAEKSFVEPYARKAPGIGTGEDPR
jgi:hypothetical protein